MARHACIGVAHRLLSQTFEVFFDLSYSFPFIALQTSRPFPHPGLSTLPRYRGAEVRFDSI